MEGSADGKARYDGSCDVDGVPVGDVEGNITW